MSNSEKHTHTNMHTGKSEKTADFLAEKNNEKIQKSVLHNYPVEDKRKGVRIEHTDGSTPRGDQ